MGVKKRKRDRAEQSLGGIKLATNPEDAPIQFSFAYFDGSDPEVCSEVFSDGYVRALMEKLKNLSSWKIQEFLSNRTPSLKCHPIKWDETSRPNGFCRLPSQYEGCTAYQFCITRNKHGRVHGIITGNTFHIVWLDSKHAVYANP